MWIKLAHLICRVSWQAGETQGELMFTWSIELMFQAIRQEEMILQVKSKGSLIGLFMLGESPSLCSVQAFSWLYEAHW